MMSSSPPETVLAAVDQQARREDRDPEDEGDERRQDRGEVGDPPKAPDSLIEDQQASHEADEQGDQRE